MGKGGGAPSKRTQIIDKMGNITNQVRYVLRLDDKVSKPLGNIDRNAGRAEGSLASLSKRTASLREGFGRAAAEIPGLGSALRLVKNPIVGGVAAIGALTVGLKKASDAAATFQHNFRDLENLNLDKSRKQLDMLRAMVTETAKLRGFDINATNTAFYDVQSITGAYGASVADFVNKEGLFAQVNKADMNAWIAGTAKAQANYGFGNEDLDRYNKSAYATMKAGYLTLDQFAQVAAVYAGAAGAAKQDFDTANKMLTLFTLRTKSVDEASTMVKSFFTDYSKESTIKAFKAAGIDMFDKNRQLKQADVLLRELNKQFLAMGKNHEAIVNLRNAFKGSEGLTMAINAATGDLSTFEGTLQSFESSFYDEDTAIKNMMKDSVELNNILKNKMSVTLVQLGRDTLGLRNAWLEVKIAAVDAIGSMLRSSDEWAVKHEQSLREEFDYLDVKGMTDLEYKSFKQQLLSRRSAVQKDADFAQSMRWYPLRGYNKDYRSALGEIAAIDQYLEALDARRNGAASSAVLSPESIATSAGGGSAVSEDMLKVLGGGSQQKTVNVHIGSLIDNQTIQSATLPESLPDITRIVEEAIIRAVGGAEQMLATS